jgi:hypothetical protein
MSSSNCDALQIELKLPPLPRGAVISNLNAARRHRHRLTKYKLFVSALGKKRSSFTPTCIGRWFDAYVHLVVQTYY